MPGGRAVLRLKSAIASAPGRYPRSYPATRRKLLENFDGLAGIAANTEELQAVPGLPVKTAQAVYDYFHQEGDPA